MDWIKIIGYIVYAIGIIGSVQGVIKKSVPICVIGLGVIVIGSILLGFKNKEK